MIVGGHHESIRSIELDELIAHVSVCKKLVSKLIMELGDHKTMKDPNACCAGVNPRLLSSIAIANIY